MIAENSRPKPSLATRTFTVPAGQSVEYVRRADFITCLSASAAFVLSMDNGPSTEFEAGLSYRPEGGVHKIEIINTTGEVLTVQLAFGRGDIRDNRATFSGALSMSENMPDTLISNRVTVNPGETRVLVSANPLRREIIIQNRTPGRFYVGGFVAFDLQTMIDSGQTLTLQTSALIYVTNMSSYIRNLQYMELLRSI